MQVMQSYYETRTYSKIELIAKYLPPLCINFSSKVICYLTSAPDTVVNPVKT